MLDSPIHPRPPPHAKKHHTSFYNPRDASDSDTSSSDDDDISLRDQSPELAETDDRGLRSRTRSLKGFIVPRRWPDRLKSGDSSLGTGGSGSNSSTSLSGGQESSGRISPEYNPPTTVRGSMSDIGSEDLPMTKLSMTTRNEDTRILSPFVLIGFTFVNVSLRIYSVSQRR
jgi:hypothetical protein